MFPRKSKGGLDGICCLGPPGDLTRTLPQRLPSHSIHANQRERIKSAFATIFEPLSIRTFAVNIKILSSLNTFLKTFLALLNGLEML